MMLMLMDWMGTTIEGDMGVMTSADPNPRTRPPTLRVDNTSLQERGVNAVTCEMVVLNFSLTPEATHRVYELLICLAKFGDTVSLEARNEKVGFLPFFPGIDLQFRSLRLRL